MHFYWIGLFTGKQREDNRLKPSFLKDLQYIDCQGDNVSYGWKPSNLLVIVIVTLVKVDGTYLYFL